MKIPASSLAGDGSQPGVVIKVGHIDNQCISLPVAYGVTEVRGIHVGAMRPAIGRYEAITPRLISIAGVYLIKNHGELRCLDDLPWSACAWDPQRSAVECRIRVHSVGS